MKRYLLFLIASVLIIGLTSCSEEEIKNSIIPEESPPEEPEATVNYSVGSEIKIDEIDYIVVDNTISSTLSRNVIAGIIDIESYSLERGLKLVHDYFDNCIVAIRKSGKITAYQDYKNDEDVMNVFNTVVPEIIPDGYTEKDFFEWSTNSSNKNFFYRDIYLALDSSLNKLGQLDVIWSSMSMGTLTKENGESIAFSEAIKTMDFFTIRNNIPEEYKIKSNSIGLLNDIYISSEGVIYSDQKYVDDFRFMKEEIYPKAAAVIWRNYDKTTGEWTSSNVCLLGKYASETSTGMLRLSVSKRTSYDEHDEPYNYYTYSITGASGYDGTITFDEKNYFKAENVEVTNQNYAWNTGCTIYDDSGLPYCETARNVPVEFILNDDGTVEFGPTVYAWAKAWRDYVVEHNETASYMK